MIDYGELMDQEAQKAPEPQAPDTAPTPETSGGVDYGALMDQEKAQDENALKAAIHVGAQKDPDQYAKVVDLSKRMSLPPDIVESQYDTLAVEQKRMFTPIDGVIKETPNSARWLTDPVNAALAMDDLSTLQKIEKHIDDYGTANRVMSTLNTGLYEILGGAAKIPALAYDVAAIPQNAYYYYTGSDKRVQSPDWMWKNPITNFFETQKEKYNIPELSSSFVEEAKKGNYVEAGRIYAYQVLKQAPQMAFMWVGARMQAEKTALTFLGTETSTTSLEESRAKGVDPVVGVPVAVAKGGIEMLSENLGTLGLFKTWEHGLVKNFGKEGAAKITMSFFQNLAYFGLGEGAEEISASYSQDLLDYYSGNNPKAMEGMHQRALESFLVGAGSGATMTFPGAVGIGVLSNKEYARQNQILRERAQNIIRGGPQADGNIDVNLAGQQAIAIPTGTREEFEQKQKQKIATIVKNKVAAAAKELYVKIGEAVSESKLKERSPEKFQEAIQEISKETGSDKVYIPVDAFTSFFQSAAEKAQAPAPEGQVKSEPTKPEHEIFTKGPAAVANYLGVTDSYETAKETTGGDVAIPLSVWVAKVHGAPAYSALSNDVKFSPNNDTINQAAEEAKAVQEQMQAAVDEAKAQAQAEEDRLHQANAEEVGRVMEQRVMGAGRSKQEAKAIGTLFKRSFGILAKKGNKDVLELFKRWGVNVVAPGESAQQSMIEMPDGVVAPTAAPVAQPTEQKPFERPYKPMPGLNEGEREIEDRFGKLLFETPVEEVDALYDAHPESMGGRILSADIVKDLSPDFQTRDQRMANSVAVHAPSSVWIKQRYARDLNRKNAKSMVTLIGGGPGAGKTSSLVGTQLGELANISDIVFDQTLADYKDAEEQIGLALESGHGVVLGNVFRPIDKAAEGVAERMNRSGRTVPASVTVEKAIQAQEVFLKLWETYGPNGPKHSPLVVLKAINNGGEFGKAFELNNVEDLNKLRYIKDGESVEEAVQRFLPLAEERLKDAQNQIVQAKSRLEFERQNLRGGQETRGEAGSSEGQGVPSQREEGGPNLGEQSQLSEEVTPEDIEQALIGMRADIEAAENTRGVNVDNQENQPGTRANYWQFSTYPSWYSELGLKNKEQFYKVLETRSGPVWARILPVAQEYARRGKAGQRYFQGAVPALVHPARRLSPLGFYSQLESEVSNMQFKVMPAADLANRIKNIQGIKADELETTGILDWLKLQDELSKKPGFWVKVTQQDGSVYHENWWETKDAAEQDADYHRKAPGTNWTVEVREGPQVSGRIEKEAVLQFIQDNGVKLEQVVLSEDYQDDSTSGVSDLDWSEPERDHSNDSDDVYNEAQYYLSENDWIKENTDELRAELLDEYTDDGEVDEAGLKIAIKKGLKDRAYEIAQEYVDSDEFSGARYIVTEHTTRTYIYGSDEVGWYAEGPGELGYNLNEAKIKVSQYLIEQGEIEGDASDLSQEKDFSWGRQRSDKPSYDTIERKTKALVKSDYERLKKAVLTEDADYYKDISGEEYDETLERDIKSRAQMEVEALYDDPENARNKISVYIDHPVIEGRVVGNNKKGWTLKTDARMGKEYGRKVVTHEALDIKLKAKDLEAAKEEAKKLLIENGLMKATDKADTSSDVNAPTGRSKFHGYSKNRGDNYREILLTLPENKDMFTEGHWSQKNVLAHVRIYDTTDEKNRKVLFVDELQSDWHQKGRERGYKGDLPRSQNFESFVRSNYPDQLTDVHSMWKNDSNPIYKEWRDLEDKIIQNSSAIANAPYKQTEAWASLAIKRIIKMAVEQGYDAVAFSPAEIHTERWGTDSISWVKKQENVVDIVDPEGRRVGSYDSKESAEAALEFMKQAFIHHDAIAKRYNEGVEKYREDNDARSGFDSVARAAVKAGYVSEIDYDALKIYNALNDEHSAKPQDLKINEVGPHWLVGSVEQRGGNIEGQNLEEVARRRGQLLERHGERVTTKEELSEIIKSTLHRERSQRSLESLTDSVWKQMQENPTGKKLPRKEGFDFFYDNLIPKKVLPAILKKLDKSAKVEVGEYKTSVPSDKNYVFSPHSSLEGGPLKAPTLTLTPEIKAKVQEGFTLFQGNKGEAPRGQISFGIDGKATIQIFEKADFSTFIHESAHLFLEIMGELAQDPNSSQEIKDDFAKVLAWFGVESRNQIATEHHEQWARGFEAYLMEGKAPTPELRSLFARFKMWLIEVYKGITNLGVELTPEVRGVMDRLVATQQEIERANQELKTEPMFDGTNLTAQQMEKYNAAVDAAKTYAEDQLTIKVMESYYKEQEAAYKDKKAELREEFEKQLNGDKLYRAISIMQKGTMPDGSPLPAGVSQIKLDRDAVMNTYGKEWVKALPMRILAPNGEAGVHPDVAATLFGFASGDEMLRQMHDAPKKSERVEQLVADKLKQIFPDKMQDPGEFSAAALEAIHNDKKSELLKMELDYLLEMERPAFKGAIKEVAKLPRRAPDLKAVREQARAIIAKIAIKDLRPAVYLRAEQRAAAEAGKLLAAGDIAGAFAAKRKQLFAHELYKITVETREDIDKAIKRFKRILKPDEKLAKTREMDLVNAARALLARVGLGKTDKTAEEYLEQTRLYDTESYDVMIQLVQAVPQAKTQFKELSVDDFTTVKDAVFALWELSGSTKEMEIDGRRVAKEEALDALNSRLEQITVADKAKIHEQATTESDKFWMYVAGFRASLRRVTAWADAFDGGNVRGAFKTYIVNPVTDAINRYRKVKVGYLQRTLDILKTIEHTLDDKKIVSHELKYDFTKSELLGALLHTGNESNLSKLLRGYGWGEVDADGNLDTSRWDRFIQRMWAEGVLTKEDYDFVQKIWDLNEELKPEAQRAHKKMYGYYFNEITASPVKTPFGTYRGGYVPAVVDSFKVQDAQRRLDKELLEKLNNSFMFPTTGRGFTKKRVDGYAAKLSLDLRMIPSHIDKVLRFIHIEPAVKMAGRIVEDKTFQNKLELYDPTAKSDMLMPWLQRAAQQKVTFPSSGWGGKALDRFASWMRRNTGLQIMVGNVTNTLQQFAGLSLAAVKVKPRFLRNALWAYMRAPGEMAKMITEKSLFMDGRMSSMAFDLQKNIDDIILNPSKYERLVDFSVKHGYALQAAAQNIVDTVTWAAAYEQAIENGLSERDAVREADEAVKLTQGTFAAEDVSRFETGSPFQRLFTQFYSFFNMWANLLGTEYAKIIRESGLKKGAGRLVYLYVYGFMLLAVLSELIVKAMAGRFDEDDDDEYMDDFLSLFFGSQFRAATAMLPGGQILNAGVNAWNNKGYDDKISVSPSISMLESVGRTIALKPFYDLAEGSAGKRKMAVKDMLTTLGMLTSIPVAPLARPIGYMIDVNEGRAQPTGPIDYTRGLITGKPGARP